MAARISVALAPAVGIVRTISRLQEKGFSCRIRKGVFWATKAFLNSVNFLFSSWGSSLLLRDLGAATKPAASELSVQQLIIIFC